jgi:hypothetical protein
MSVFAYGNPTEAVSCLLPVPQISGFGGVMETTGWGSTVTIVLVEREQLTETPLLSKV